MPKKLNVRIVKAPKFPAHLINVSPMQLRESKRKLRETSAALEATFDLLGWWDPLTRDGSFARMKVRKLFNRHRENIEKMAASRSWVSLAEFVRQIESLQIAKGRVELSKLGPLYNALGPLRATYELEIMKFKNEMFNEAKGLNLDAQRVEEFISGFEGAYAGITENPNLVDAHFRKGFDFSKGMQLRKNPVTGNNPP